jgi:hypothetical protein
MSLLDCAILLSPLIFVGALVVTTRRHGWRGLACATVAVIVVAMGSGAIVETWMPWRPSPQDEFGFGHGFRLYAFLLGNLVIVFVTAVVLAFTIKVE